MAGYRRRVAQLGGTETARSIILDWIGLTTFDREYHARKRVGPHSPKTFVLFAFHIKCAYSLASGTRCKIIEY